MSKIVDYIWQEVYQRLVFLCLYLAQVPDRTVQNMNVLSITSIMPCVKTRVELTSIKREVNP